MDKITINRYGNKIKEIIVEVVKDNELEALKECMKIIQREVIKREFDSNNGFTR